MTESPRAKTTKETQSPHPWAPDSSHPQTPATLPAPPDIQWFRWAFSLSSAQQPTSYFPSPYPLPAPLVLTSHQPRVQRVKARVCERGMWDSHEGNPPGGGAGRPGAARPAQEDPGPLIRVGPCASCWGGYRDGGVCAVIGLQVHRATRRPPGLWRDFKGHGQGAPGSPSLSQSPVLIASKTTF